MIYLFCFSVLNIQRCLSYCENPTLECMHSLKWKIKFALYN